MSRGIVFVFIAIGSIWLIIFFICRSAAKAAVERKGNTVISIRWALFGYGWFGEKDSIIFKIKYKDMDGRIHTTYCKSGLLSGVYFSKDEIDE
ncbi:MAG: hypothetical protein ACK4YF_05565 [Exilispira sp.]